MPGRILPGPFSPSSRSLFNRFLGLFLSICLDVEIGKEDKHEDVLDEAADQNEFGHITIVVQHREAKVNDQDEELDL